MVDSQIGIIISARDEATRVLQNVRQEMALFGPSGQVLVDLGRKAEETAGGIQKIGTSASASLGPMKVLGNELISSLAPALGQVGIAIVNVTQATDRLRLGLPLLASGGAAAAVVIGTELVGAIVRARQEFLAWERDVNSMDISRITGQVRGLRLEMEELAQSNRNLQGLDPFSTVTRLWNDFRLGSIQPRLESSTGRLQFLERGMGPGATPDDFGPSPSLNAWREEQARRTFELELSQRGLFDFRLHPLDAEMAQAQRDAADLARPNSPGGPQGAAAGRVLAAAAERRRRGLFRAFRAPDYAATYDESLAFGVNILPDALARQETTSILARMGTPEYIRQREGDLRGAAVAGDESLAFGVSGSQLAAGSQRALQERVNLGREELELQRQILEAQSERLDLTDRDRDLIEDRLTGLRTAVDLARVDAELESARAVAEEERDNARIERLERERAVIEAIAGIRAGVTAQQRLERYDPVVGALRGAQDFEDLAARQGDRFRMALFGSLQNVSGGITEILVQGISGDLDRIGDIGKQMGQALMRGLIQELVVTPMVSALSGALRGAIGAAFGGGYGTAAAAGGGGLLAMLGLGGTAQAAAGTAPNLPVGSMVQTAAGTGVVTASGSVVLTGSGGAGAVGAGNDLVASAAAGASPFGGSVSAMPTSSQAAVGGASATSAILGGAAGIAAVGLTAYSASQYATTTQDVAFAGISGAISGAAAGAAIGGYYDSSGYGALIGAVAGAAIAAGGAAYGKRQNRASREEREQAEVSGVAASFQPMFTDLDAAQTPEELYAVVRRYTHAGRGGERSGRGPENAGLIVSVNVAGSVRRVIDEGVTPAQLVQFGDTAMVSIQVGVAPEVKAPFEERIARAIQQAASRIRGVGDQVRIFFERHLRGGVTKTTVLTLTRLAEAVGQDLSIVAGTLNGLDPDVRAKILERIAAADVDGAAQLYAVESNLQNKVRLGEVLAARRLLPPSAGGPDIGGLLDEASRLGPDGLEQIIRDGMLNWSPGGGEAGPEGPPSDGVASVSFDGPNINVTFQDSSVVTVTPSVPDPIGEAISLGLQGLGVPAGLANALGAVGEAAIGLFGGPIGSLIGLGNKVVGFIKQQIVQNPGKRTLNLPKITLTPPRVNITGPDPDEAAPQSEPTVPEGVVNVGELSIVGIGPEGASPDGGSSSSAGGDGTGGPAAGGTGGSGDPSAYGRGGWVRGEGRGDRVRVRLEPKEFVVNRESAAEHAPELEEINRRRPGRWPLGLSKMTEDELIELGNQLARANRKYDRKWWQDPGGPMTPAWGI